jgi:uncharacterized membrane protein YcaP (DUF421 family)
MNTMLEAINELLGLQRQAQELTTLNVSMRALVVFLGGLVILRFGNRRFMGQSTAFDVLLGILLGSVLSRGISGTAAFVPTLAGTLVIVLLHRGLATLVYFVPGLARIVEGEPTTVIREGVIERRMTRRTRLTDQDLQEAMRLRGIGNLEEVKHASLEVDGSISIVPNAIRIGPVDLAGVRSGNVIRIELSVR